MELFIIVILLVILAEVTYIIYKQTPRASIPATSILMDTSALIDGRIVAIARSGLITSPLVVPKSVIAELQFMADKADHDKRERARFGLDVIDTLQQLEDVELKTFDDHNDEHIEVDEQLIRIAQQHGSRLCTIDYNLNKAARVQGVNVININELAHALRIVHLPGEETTVKIVQSGQERDQGVGYLDDGTMVVVEDAKKLIDKEVQVAVTRVLQTAAGKMMFAKLASSSNKPKQPKRLTGLAKHNAAPKVGRTTDNKKSSSSAEVTVAANGRKKYSSRKQRNHTPQQAESNLVELANQEKDPRN